MNLATPPPQYAKSYENRRNNTLEQADRENRKRGQDVELGAGERIIARSPDGTRWAIAVQNDGSLTTSLV